MKTILLISPILLSTALLSNELSWVDKQVDAIKPVRIGVNTRVLASTKSPFIFLEKNRDEKAKKLKKSIQTKVTTNSNKPIINRHIKNKTVTTVLSLEAILNNSVMINGAWYKIGDSINGYKVQEMNYNSVLLVKNKKRLLLSTKSRSKTIKFQN